MAHYIIIELSHGKEECLQALTTIVNLGSTSGTIHGGAAVPGFTPAGWTSK